MKIRIYDNVEKGCEVTFEFTEKEYELFKFNNINIWVERGVNR